MIIKAKVRGVIWIPGNDIPQQRWELTHCYTEWAAEEMAQEWIEAEAKRLKAEDERQYDPVSQVILNTVLTQEREQKAREAGIQAFVEQDAKVRAKRDLALQLGEQGYGGLQIEAIWEMAGVTVDICHMSPEETYEAMANATIEDYDRHWQAFEMTSRGRGGGVHRHP